MAGDHGHVERDDQGPGRVTEHHVAGDHGHVEVDDQGPGRGLALVSERQADGAGRTGGLTNVAALLGRVDAQAATSEVLIGR